MIAVILLFITPAYASQDLNSCISLLTVPAKSLDELEAKLPKVSEQAETYFSRWHKNMDLGRFYSLKDRPQYYLWLLNHDLKEAKTNLANELLTYGSDDTRNRLAFTGWLFFYSSNLRNSWTEYAAYSGDTSLSEAEKDKISVDMLRLIGAINVYYGCLMADWQKTEK